jgi:hypothetical protein
MAEWLKAHAWKACVGNTTVSSNLTLSATFQGDARWDKKPRYLCVRIDSASSLLAQYSFPLQTSIGIYDRTVMSHSCGVHLNLLTLVKISLKSLCQRGFLIFYDRANTSVNCLTWLVIRGQPSLMPGKPKTRQDHLVEF